MLRRPPLRQLQNLSTSASTAATPSELSGRSRSRAPERPPSLVIVIVIEIVISNSRNVTRPPLAESGALRAEP